ASGDPHYLTFDGKAYDFQGTCRYVLATVCNDTVDLHQFSVKAKNEPWFGLPVSITAEVYVDVLGYEVRMSRGNWGTVEVNGITRNLPIVFNGSLSIFGSGSQTFVNTEFGLSVMYDGSSTASISVPPSYRGNMCGLCGNFNGNPNDDFHTPSGASSNSADVFGAAWKVPGNYTCSDGCGSSCAQCNDDRSARAQCEVIQAADGPFSFCHEEVDPAPYFSDCVFDVCVSGNRGSDLLCRALETYVSACQSANVRVYPWRQNTTCKLTCPSNSHYELCGSSCPSSCPSLSFPFTCDTQCQEGCQCNDGFVLNGNQCVPPTSCGCFHDGRYRQAGEQFWDGEECQSFCTCNGVTGIAQCSPNACGPQESCSVVDGEFGCHPNPHGTCSASGDPHYLTFDGKAYDFQGTCRYVLATVCNDTVDLHQFSVEAKNEPWFGLPVSITAEVYVDIFGYEVRMSRDKKGTVDVNGITRNLPVVFNGSLSIFGSGSQTFVKTDFGLSVMYDGSSTVSISVSPDYRGNMCGLCGNFNGNPNDDFHTPSGASSNSADAFGAAWKVPGNYTCSDGCGSSCAQCNDDRSARAQCEVIQAADGPFSFCHEEVDPAPYFSDCVFDVCVSGSQGSDLLCRAIETYVSACQSANVRIYPWRQNTTCTEMDPCEQLDCAEHEWCGKKNGVYGCFCDEHHHRPNNESYADANIECSSSSGTMSVSRCQLFEAGFHSSALHLQDSSCNGTLQDGRLIFHFDNDNHLCGTALRSNGTHFMYENTIKGNVDPHGGLINRERNLHLDFSCIYPLAQALSMAVGINPVESILRKKLPVGTGSYRVRMIPYEDEGFHFPFSTNGNIELEVDEMFYVEVRTEGVDQRQFATVLDSCWATPVNQANYPVRWDLITSQCPNPEDGTVEVIQNGVSTVSRFSFRMFTFTNHTEIYLHCSVHLCLLSSNNC
uniref:Uncharacterized protein n=1 Tax=Poecilia formosa TaxID=48698 RepID=A0A087YB60_POEFO